MTATGPPHRGPAPIWSIIHGLAGYWTLVAALDLGVFDQLATGPASPDDLAGRCGATSKGTRAVMGSLVAIGLAEFDGEEYRITPEADAFLVRDRPGFMGGLVLHADGPWINWPALAATARGADPPHPVDVDGEFHRKLVESTFFTQYRTAAAVAAELQLSALAPPPRILDLGAGGGPWSVALLEAAPGAVAVINDLPQVIEVAARQVAQSDLTDRTTLLPGNYLEIPIEPGQFDIVVLGHVCRAEEPDAAQALVGRAADAVRPGGRVIVADYLLDDDETGPAHAQLLGITMAANTRHGFVYSAATVSSWLTDAGLTPPHRLAAIPPTSVLVSSKAGAP